MEPMNADAKSRTEDATSVIAWPAVGLRPRLRLDDDAELRSSAAARLRPLASAFHGVIDPRGVGAAVTVASMS